jgi:arylsulfatase A-like enzyme
MTASRRLTVAVAALVLACAPPTPEPPNIVLILADDLGFGHLGSFGQSLIRTPHLDRLAAEGRRFTGFYSGSTVCAPARSVLMTGLHTGHTPVRANYGGVSLAEEDVTLAEVLKSAGYATGIFGKWGLGDHGTPGVPWAQGFDEFVGYLNQVHAHFYYPEFLWDNDERLELADNANGSRASYSHDVIVERGLDFVRRHADERFFLYLPFTIPHTELLVPEESMTEYAGSFPEPTPYPGDGHYAAQAEPRTAFAAMVTRMDRDVGRLMALLAELDLDDETLVLFASDNGGQAGWGVDLEFFAGNAPFRGSKMNLYEGGIRVPAIARWPGVIPPGTTSDHLWAFWDLLPTLADVADAVAPAEIDGRSMAALLGVGDAAPTHDYLYWEYGGTTGVTNLRQAVRMGAWKGVRTGPEDAWELYDLVVDTAESRDLAAERPDIVETIAALARDARTEPRPVPEALQTFRYVGQRP